MEKLTIEEINQIVEEYMLVNGFETKKELYDQIGVSKVTLWKFLNRHSIGRSSLIKITKALNIDILRY